MLKAALKFIPAILILLIIFRFSAATSEESSKTSESVTAKLVKLIHIEVEEETLSLIEDIVREAAHFTEYLILALACVFALSTWQMRPLYRYGFLQIFCTLFAISDEVHQYFVPGRWFQVQDIVVDSLGAFVGLWGCWLVEKKR